MLSQAKVQEAVQVFERVEWKYDGIGGRVIQWTKQHGNANDDPSVLVWVLDAKESVIGAPSAGEYQAPGPFAKWLSEMKVEHDRKTARIPPEMAVQWEESSATVMEGVTSAIDQGKPVFVYVAIPQERQDEKEWKAARKECLKFEHGALADKGLAELAAKCYSVRLDFSDDAVKDLVKAWGVKRAPALVLIDPKKKDAKPKIWTSSTVKADEIVRLMKPLLNQ